MADTAIFDLDGTLLDTLQDLTNSVNYALAAHALPQRSKAEVRSFLGYGYQGLIGSAVPKSTPPKTEGEVLATFSDYYTAHCLEATCPYVGVEDALRTLRAAGVKMAIVSNKGDAAVQELAQRFFLGLVDVAVGTGPAVPRKPAPDTLLAAMARLGSKRQECVYVGDSEVDILTAKHAGVPCLTCLWGFRDRDFLLQHGATHLVERPADLPAAIMQ